MFGYLDAGTGAAIVAALAGGAAGAKVAARSLAAKLKRTKTYTGGDLRGEDLGTQKPGRASTNAPE